MSKFLTWMRNELEGIKQADIKAPTGKVGDGEEVVGRLESLEVQRLFALSSRLREQTLALVKELTHQLIDRPDRENRPDHDPDTCEQCALARQVTVLSDKNDALNGLFWTSVRHELSSESLAKVAKSGTVVGIREGWQIVAVKSTAERSHFGIAIPIPEGLLLGF